MAFSPSIHSDANGSVGANRCSKTIREIKPGARQLDHAFLPCQQDRARLHGTEPTPHGRQHARKQVALEFGTGVSANEVGRGVGHADQTCGCASFLKERRKQETRHQHGHLPGSFWSLRCCFILAKCALKLIGVSLCFFEARCLLFSPPCHCQVQERTFNSSAVSGLSW